MRFVLASSSPRRKEILGYFISHFEIQSPPFDEESIAFRGDPVAYVRTLSEGKAHSLKTGEEELLISADTTVYCGGKIYNKPKDRQHALEMLQELSGNTHSVYTAVTAKVGAKWHTEHEKTDVTFHTMTHEQMMRYVDAIDPLDKAGSYMIQGKGSIAIHKIDGCYCNVMGLPIHALARVLNAFGINLWHHLS